MATQQYPKRHYGHTTVAQRLKKNCHTTISKRDLMATRQYLNDTLRPHNYRRPARQRHHSGFVTLLSCLPCRPIVFLSSSDLLGSPTMKQIFAPITNMPSMRSTQLSNQTSSLFAKRDIASGNNKKKGGGGGGIGAGRWEEEEGGVAFHKQHKTKLEKEKEEIDGAAHRSAKIN